MNNPRAMAREVALPILVSVIGLANPGVAHAVTGPFQWKGHTWQPTTGAMAGVVPGDPSNVFVDASGFLHLSITTTGGGWTAAEVFTTDSLGFGTYQWQIAGPIDRMDHTVVLGLYPYGPQAGIGADGTNEIDTEFSFWNDEAPNVNADWTVYPPTTAGTVWEDDFSFSLSGGSSTTARMTWGPTSVVGTLMSGFQAIGSTSQVLMTQTYSPASPEQDIPQQPLPLGMNLWCYKAVPSSGQNVEVVIQDFQFVPEAKDSGASSNAMPDSGGSSNAVPDSGGSSNAMPDGGGSMSGRASEAGSGAANGAGSGGSGASVGDAIAPSAGGGHTTGCAVAADRAVPASGSNALLGLAVVLSLARRRRTCAMGKSLRPRLRAGP